jgi:hypothetical protein
VLKEDTREKCLRTSCTSERFLRIQESFSVKRNARNLRVYKNISSVYFCRIKILYYWRHYERISLWHFVKTSVEASVKVKFAYVYNSASTKTYVFGTFFCCVVLTYSSYTFHCLRRGANNEYFCKCFASAAWNINKFSSHIFTAMMTFQKGREFFCEFFRCDDKILAFCACARKKKQHVS